MRVPPIVGLLAAAAFAVAPVCAQTEPNVLPGIFYKTGDQLSEYEQERCHLDLYLPGEGSEFPTLVWFHGGGLTAGAADAEFTRKNARAFADKGVAVAVVEYRLSPKVTYPAYIEDAAAGVAWVFSHIAEHGGVPEKIFVGGHSAGAYLSAMVGMDPRYLAKHGIGLEQLAGLVLLSGQMTTHFTVRAERGIGKNTIISDEAAPLFHSRAEAPPMIVLWADKDMATRAEENALFVAVQKTAGNARVIGRQIAGRDHGSIAKKMSEPGDETAAAILEFIQHPPEAPAKKP